MIIVKFTTCLDYSSTLQCMCIRFHYFKNGMEFNVMHTMLMIWHILKNIFMLTYVYEKFIMMKFENS